MELVDPINVFERGQRTSSLPSTRMEREGAQELVTTGFARWVNDRRKSIQMTREPATLKMRDTSCQMGPKVIWRYLLGEPAAVAIVESFRGVPAANLRAGYLICETLI